ncbi:hypothetical protein GTR02_07585 [Kineococcus sp. R8]|uniref:hypothetical protein n=1 Tax=Kineococcus siccus TaxID=2696567 RepID=UPI0014123AE4|nr:hypothetical protein [Kineococcus siccus]NAZ81678.1 hypothetical protein [Kineococcus siccus]
MSDLHSAPIVSGLGYAVEDVAGTPPRSFEDFRGEVSFSVRAGEHAHDVVGIGEASGEGATVHEKMGGPGGKDVRTWRITRADGGFVAEHVLH